MKKLLSIILACAMLMSLFCVVPASATANTTHQKLPYVFEDFEGADGKGGTGIVATNSSSAEVSVVADATRGGYVLKGESANNVAGGPALLSYAYKENEEDTKESFCETFAAGETIVISAWVKLGTVQDSASLNFILYHSSYTTLYGTVANPLNTTSWQKVSAKHTFSAETTLSKIEMRFVGTSTDSHNVVMYVDDLEIKKDNRQPVQVGKVYSHSGKVSGANPGWFQNQMAANGNGNTSVTITGHDGADNVVSKIQYATTSSVANQMHQSSAGQTYSLAAGDKLEVELWVKLDEATANDKIYYAYSIGTKTVWTIEFDGKSTDWQHLHRVVEMTSAVSGAIYRNFTRNDESKGWSACMYQSNPKTAAGTYPVMYIDDFKMQAYTPVFEGTKQAPDTVNASASYSDGGNAAYWENNVITRSTETGTLYDGSTGTYAKFVYNSENGKLSRLYQLMNLNPAVAVSAGDQVKISMKIKLSEALATDKGYYVFATLGGTPSITFSAEFDGKSTDWQDISVTHTVAEATSFSNVYQLFASSFSGAGVGNCNSNYRMKAADGSEMEFYVDDFSIKFVTPGQITTGVTTIPVVSNATASRGATGAITAAYTLKTNGGADIEAANEKSFYKLVGASGRVYSSSATLAGLVYPTSASETIKLQIIPATAAYIGDVVEVAIIDLSAYNGIEIVEADDTMAVISTDTALTNAKLIWVGYTDDTDHGCIEMTGVATANVTMDAYAEAEFAAVGDLGDYTFVKVFLWSDLTTAYAPLASYYEY